MTNDGRKPPARFAGIVYDEARCCLALSSGAMISLRRQSLQVFGYLAERHDTVVAKSDLFAAIWPGRTVTDDSLVQCIADIRRALGPHGRRILRTIPCQGYMLLADAPDGDLVLPPSGTAPILAPVPRPRRDERHALALIGREHALARLRETLDDVLAGENRFVLIRADPGIGKTRLAHEFLDRIASENLAWAECSCYEIGSAVGYAAISAWLRSPPIYSRLSRLDESSRSEVGRLLCEIEPVGRPHQASLQANPEAWNRTRFFGAVRRALTPLGRPAVLVLDNLQWSDSETQQWIDYALRQPAAPGLMIVATMRKQPSPRDAVDDLLISLTHAGLSEIIDLPALDERDAGRLAQCVSPRWTDAVDPQQLHRLTEGIPLFIIELIRSRQGLAGPHGNAAGRLMAAFDTRLDNLSDAQQRALNAASALGGEFTRSLLIRVSGLAHRQGEKAIAELQARNLLTPVEQALTFRHELLRELVYARIDVGEARRIHADIARNLPDPLTRSVHASDCWRDRYARADHFARAGLWRQAYEDYIQVARHARRHHAVHAEARAIQKALATIDHMPQNTSLQAAAIELLLDLGLAHSTISGWGSEATRRAWQSAYDLSVLNGSTVLRARAVNAMDTYYRDVGLWNRCETLSDSAMDLLDAIDDPYLRLCLMSSRAALLLHTGKPAQSLAGYDAVIRQSGAHIEPSFNWFNRTFEVGAYFRSAQCLWLLGDVEQAKFRARIALDLAERNSDPFHLAITLFHVAMLHELCGDCDAVLRLADQLGKTAARFGYGFYRGSARLFEAFAKIRLRADEHSLDVMESITEAQERGGTRMFEPYWRANLAHARLACGRPTEALRLARHALRESAAKRNEYWDAQLNIIAGRCLQVGSADSPRARQAFERACATARRQGATMLLERALQAMDSFDCPCGPGAGEANPGELSTRRILRPQGTRTPEGVVVKGRRMR